MSCQVQQCGELNRLKGLLSNLHIWVLSRLHRYKELKPAHFRFYCAQYTTVSRGNQKPQFEGQTIQWPNVKWRKDKQWSTKHNTKVLEKHKQWSTKHNTKVLEKYKQWSTKHNTKVLEKYKQWGTNHLLRKLKIEQYQSHKNQSRSSGRVCSSCTISDNRRVNVNRFEHHVIWKLCWIVVVNKYKLGQYNSMITEWS